MIKNLSQIIINTPISSVDFSDGGYKIAEGHKTFNIKNLILNSSKELVSRCGFSGATPYKEKMIEEKDVTLHRVWASPYRSGDFFLYISCWQLETVAITNDEDSKTIKIDWGNNLENSPDDYFQYWRRTDKIQLQYETLVNIGNADEDDEQEIGEEINNEGNNENENEVDREIRYWEIESQNHRDIGNTRRVQYNDTAITISLTDSEWTYFQSISNKLSNRVKIHVGRLCYVTRDRDNVQYMLSKIPSFRTSYFPYSAVQTGLEHTTGFYVANGVSSLIRINYKENADSDEIEQENNDELYNFEPVIEEIPLRLQEARFWNLDSGYEKYKMKFTAEEGTGKLQIDFLPTRDSTVLIKNNTVSLRNEDNQNKLTAKILEVNYQQQKELEVEGIKYTTTADKWTFVIEHPEWDKDSTLWNNKDLFITNPQWTEIDNNTEHQGYTKDEAGFYFRYKLNNVQLYESEVVFKEIPNPELPGSNEQERWLLFYTEPPKAILPTDPQGLPNMNGSRIEYTGAKTTKVEVQKFPETIKVNGDNQMHCYITLDVEAAQFIEQRENINRQFSLKNWTLSLYVPTPKLSVIYQYHGYLYGVGLADIHNHYTKETYENQYLLYRTTIAGYADKWYDPAHASFYFQNLKDYFPRNDYPIALISNQQYLYIVGTQFTQVWLPKNDPVQAITLDAEGNVKAPEHINIFGQYISTLESGIPAPGLVFIHANFVTLINQEGVYIINPFTLNDKPEIVKADVYNELIRKLFSITESSSWLQSCVYPYRGSYYIKIGDQEQALFLQDIGNNQFFASIFNSRILTNSIPVLNAQNNLILANIKNQNVAFYQYKDEPAIYTDDKDTPIECSWSFAVMFPQHRIWQNMRINLNIEHEEREPLQANVQIISNRNYPLDSESRMNFTLQNQHLPDNNYVADFIFKDNYKVLTKSVYFFGEMARVNVTLNVKHKIVINNFIFMGGVTNAITEY